MLCAHPAALSFPISQGAHEVGQNHLRKATSFARALPGRRDESSALLGQKRDLSLFVSDFFGVD